MMLIYLLLLLLTTTISAHKPRHVTRNPPHQQPPHNALKLFTNSSSINIYNPLLGSALTISKSPNSPNNVTCTTSLSGGFSNTSTTDIFAIYGIYHLPRSNKIALAVITNSSLVVTNEMISAGSGSHVYKGGGIRRVTGLDLLEVPSSVVSKNSSNSQPGIFCADDVDQLRLLKKTFLSHELYFCESNCVDGSGGDVTHTLQRIFAENDNNVVAPEPDSRFHWNSQPSISLPSAFSTPVTSAFIGHFHLKSTTQILISRRSKHRAGVRFVMRGADKFGHCANFVESEQILIENGNGNGNGSSATTSHVQLRGSIPLKWSSPALLTSRNPPVSIGADPVEQARRMGRHFRGIFERYGDNLVTVLNLIDKNTSTRDKDKNRDQPRLGRAYESVFKALSDATKRGLEGQVRNVWFDFHNEVRGRRGVERLGNGGVGDLLYEGTGGAYSVGSDVISQGAFRIIFSHKSSKKSTIISTQNGIIRTNCMDCLDRTNVVQSLIALSVAERNLEDQGFDQGEGVEQKQNHLKHHRLLWSNNADALSTLYAGTRALKSDVTRTGRRTYGGAVDDGLNSLRRYVGNNFYDERRQEGVEVLIGGCLGGQMGMGKGKGKGKEKRVGRGKGLIFRIQKSGDELEGDEEEDDWDDADADAEGFLDNLDTDLASNFSLSKIFSDVFIAYLSYFLASRYLF